MTERGSVALLFGGQSAEHEVSIRSAGHVRDALLAADYRVELIAIEKHGVWRLAPEIAPPDPGWPRVALLPGSGGEIHTLDGGAAPRPVDAVFPVLHGPHGEDGSLQGLLKLAKVAFVGSGVFASALCMDKDYAKQVLRAADLPTVQGLTLRHDSAPDYATVSAALGSPLFVKPANMGSSVGVSKVGDAAAYRAALASAFRYDSKVLVESFAEGREIECAVLALGDSLLDDLAASKPGEIVPAGTHGFYSYDAKYLDDEGAALLVPADLPDGIARRVQKLSLAATRATGCEGLVRVDFFLKPDGELLINELNTIPGFTSISMYPKLWEASGIPPEKLVVHLIDHALARFERDRILASDRDT
ncbi:MAG: D-alanine--D-alanine ligase family protein [Rhodospirillales bacterium]